MNCLILYLPEQKSMACVDWAKNKDRFSSRQHTRRLSDTRGGGLFYSSAQHRQQHVVRSCDRKPSSVGVAPLRRVVVASSTGCWSIAPGGNIICCGGIGWFALQGGECQCYHLFLPCALDADSQRVGEQNFRYGTRGGLWMEIEFLFSHRTRVSSCPLSIISVVRLAWRKNTRLLEEINLLISSSRCGCCSSEAANSEPSRAVAKGQVDMTHAIKWIMLAVIGPNVYEPALSEWWSHLSRTIVDEMYFIHLHRVEEIATQCHLRAVNLWMKNCA